jgi:hypothetical protein
LFIPRALSVEKFKASHQLFITEIIEVLNYHGIINHVKSTVKRNLNHVGFKTLHGTQLIIKVKYPISSLKEGKNKIQPQIPMGLTGTHFQSVIGANDLIIESLFIKRRISGSSWLFLWKPLPVDLKDKVSQCDHEYLLDSPKQIFSEKYLLNSVKTNHMNNIDTAILRRGPPKLSISLVHILHYKNNSIDKHEPLIASILHSCDFDILCCKTDELWLALDKESHTTIFYNPSGTYKEKDLNCLESQNSESLFIEEDKNEFFRRIQATIISINPDIIFGHNILKKGLMKKPQKIQNHESDSLCFNIGRLRINKIGELSSKFNENLYIKNL